MTKFMNFIRNEEGITALEYALIAALISLLIISTGVGEQLLLIFQNIATELSSV